MLPASAAAPDGHLWGAQCEAALKSIAPCPAQRYDCKDFLSLFATRDWRPLAHLALPTQDAADLAFSPDGTCFVVWDSPLDYQVCGLSASSPGSYLRAVMLTACCPLAG